MKNILLLNGGKAFARSLGRLNDTLHKTACETSGKAGFVIRQTKIDAGCDIQVEVENFLWADLVVYQMPGWWMGIPWTVKSISTRFLQPAMVYFIRAMAAAVLIRRENMVPAVCCRGNIICCLLHGMRLKKLSWMQTSFSKAKELMLSIFRFTKPINKRMNDAESTPNLYI